MFGFRLPRWLYESLPYILIFIGATSVIYLHHSAALVSFVSLILAGFYIIFLRRYYRAKAAKAEAKIKELQQLDNAPGNWIELRWKAALATGIPEIDRQHRKLFNLGNELFQASLDKSKQGDVNLLFDELLREISAHFQFEEKFFKDLGSPISSSHEEAHADLIERTRQLYDRSMKGLLPVSELIGFVAYDVISQHIEKFDLQK